MGFEGYGGAVNLIVIFYHRTEKIFQFFGGIGGIFEKTGDIPGNLCNGTQYFIHLTDRSARKIPGIFLYIFYDQVS